MPNEQNIIPHQFTSAQSREEAAKNGRKGGQASGAARRAKRDAKLIAQQVLSMKPNLPPATLDMMVRMGMSEKTKPDMRMIASLAIMQRAMKGDHKAYVYRLVDEDDGGSLEGILNLTDDPSTADEGDLVVMFEDE